MTFYTFNKLKILRKPIVYVLFFLLFDRVFVLKFLTEETKCKFPSLYNERR